MIAAAEAQPLSHEEIADVNYFLNVVNPGHQALKAALSGQYLPDVRLDPSFFGTGDVDDPDDVAVVFERAFFTQGAMERVFVLAAHSLAHALPRIRWGTGWRDSVFDGDRIARSPSFTNWAQGHVGAPSLRALQAWLPDTAPEKAANNLDRVLRYTTIPDDADVLADWLIHGLVRVGATLTQ